VFLLIAGGGKVGANLARTLIRSGNEVSLIEQRDSRYQMLEVEFEHQVHKGDATELYILERAGIQRPPDVVVAVTGDDEDNVIICQLARDNYGVETTIARVNDPRNQPYFDLLGISPTVSATASIMGLIEHEVPEHGLIHLLELRKENKEIVELTVGRGALCAGQEIGQVALPKGSKLILVVRDGKAEVPDDSMVLEEGDSVLAILEPGKEDELRRVLVRS
jgi:trk/ktr system potassium uptake protein